MAAGSKLHIAQPALSRQIGALEREVGAALLERERRGVRASPAGAALRQSADALFLRLGDAVREAHDAHAGATGLVRLGVTRVALDNARVSRAIAAVRRRFAGILLDVTEVTSLKQARAVRAREIDVAIGLADGEGDATVRRELLYEERMDHVMLPTGHPLALRGTVDVEDLRAQPLLGMRRPVSGGYLRMYQAIRDAGITMVEDQDTPEGLYAMVAAGRGWGVAARSQAANPPLGTTVVPVRGLAFTMPVSLRWRGGDRSRAVLNVTRALRDAVRDAERSEGSTVPRDVRHAAATSAGRPWEIELAQLQAFVAAVEEGSMSAAAERLRITQSGVSRRVHALERSVGCALLERATHGVMATQAGEAFLRGAEDVVRLADEALARARLAAGDITGVCRIGTLPPELTGGLQHLALRRVVSDHPRIRVELAELLPERQIALLRAGELDIALCGSWPSMEVPAELSRVQLFEDVIDSVMLVEGHPLAARAWLRAQDLAGEPFLFIDRADGRRVYDAVLHGLQEAGFRGHVGGTHGGPREVWRAIAGGDGWTIGTRAQRARPPAGLVGVPLEGLHIPWGIALLWRRDEQQAVVRQVLEVFRETRNTEMAVVVATVRAAGRDVQEP